MKRFTSSLISMCLLLTMMSGVLFSPVKAQSSIATAPSPYGISLPSSAVVGSTDERRNAYNNLTPEQQEQAKAEFRSYVQPSVDQAQADKENRFAQQSYVQTGSMGQSMQRNSASVADTTITSPFSYTAESFANYSLSLNGTSAYVNVPNSASLNITGAITVEAAVKTNSDSADQAIIERYNNFGPGTFDGGYVLRLTGGRLAFVTLRNGAEVDYVISDCVVTAGYWHHLAGVFDGNELRVYIDGTLCGRKTSTFAPGTGTGNLRIGAKGDDVSLRFNGLIDEVRVTAAAIYTANFNVVGISELTPVAETRGYWKFNNQTANDTSGNNNNGSLIGGAGFSTDVPSSASDADGDGLQETFENQLADAFTPVYFVSGGERSGTGFATFNNSVPQTVQKVFGPVPPISHFRVTPVGITIDGNGNQLGFLEIDYLTLWNRDDGIGIGFGCVGGLDALGALLGFNGDLLIAGLAPHELDLEHSATLVAAPTIGGTYNTNASAYSAYDYYTAAHENSFNDLSRYIGPTQPLPAGSHIKLALSQSKHSTYPFNPNGLPLTPTSIIFATYGTLDFLYQTNRISYVSYKVYLYIADTTFFSCFIEHFQDQGGTFAGTRINVGETNHPINSSSFIQDPNNLRPKLDRPLWILR